MLTLWNLRRRAILAFWFTSLTVALGCLESESLLHVSLSRRRVRCSTIQMCGSFLLNFTSPVNGEGGPVTSEIRMDVVHHRVT